MKNLNINYSKAWKKIKKTAIILVVAAILIATFIAGALGKIHQLLFN